MPRHHQRQHVQIAAPPSAHRGSVASIYNRNANVDGSPPLPGTLERSETAFSKMSLKKRGRAPTNSYGAHEMGQPTGWTPGQEPGFDTSDPAPPYSSAPDNGRPSYRAGITVVDYSAEDISITELDNSDLEDFLSKPQPEWVRVRWINVDGLSWDVVRCLGNYKKLHRLAIEDLLNTKNRTKVDWYNDHTYMVLPLQVRSGPQ